MNNSYAQSGMHTPVLLSIAASIEPAFPNAADTLRGIADQIADGAEAARPATLAASEDNVSALMESLERVAAEREAFKDERNAARAERDAFFGEALEFKRKRREERDRAESAEAEVERLTQVVARRKAHAEQAESERDAALVALASQDTYIEEGGLIVVGQLREQRARAESAERARDAALAEVAELRDRLGRVEALHRPYQLFEPCPTVWGCEHEHCAEDAHNGEWYHSDQPAGQACTECFTEYDGEPADWPCPTAAALAVPVTGDTEDASPAAEDEAQWTCRRCGSHGWVGWAAGPDMPRKAQCVACGAVQSLAVVGAASPTEQATEGGAK